MKFNEYNIADGANIVLMGDVTFSNLTNPITRTISDKSGRKYGDQFGYNLSIDNVVIVKSSDDALRQYVEDNLYNNQEKGIVNSFNLFSKAVETEESTPEHKVYNTIDIFDKASGKSLPATEVIPAGQTLAKGTKVAVVMNVFQPKEFANMGRSFRTVAVPNVGNLKFESIQGRDAKALEDVDFNELPF